MRADLHIHSRFSDGSDSVEQLASAILAEGLSAAALTDHDTDEGNALLKNILPSHIRFIPGIEFTCIMPRGRCHILGYGFDGNHPLFREAIEEGKRRRRQKLDRRLIYLKDTFGITFTEEELSSLYALKTVGKPHIAAILVKRGMADNVRDAIEKYMSKGKVYAEDRLAAAYAIKAIRESGGIAVWAHPLGGEGEKHIDENEFLARLSDLKAAGIQGLECFYSRYTAEESSLLLRAAKENGLLISGGSDYHGKNKDIPLATLSADGTAVAAEMLSILDRF